MEPTNSTWQWQESGTAWKGVGIYHLTLTIPTRLPLLAPTTYNENKKAISRQECVQLNHIADEIAAEKE